LALDHKPLNLGQGFPDFAAPDYVTKALAEVATGENVLLNQYTRGFVSSVCTVFLHLQLLEDGVNFLILVLCCSVFAYTVMHLL
jgi:hypothetical protein